MEESGAGYSNQPGGGGCFALALVLFFIAALAAMVSQMGTL